MIRGCFTWISEHKHLDLIILQLLRSQNVDHKTQNLLFHARQSTMTFIKVNFLLFLDPLRYLLLHMFPGSHLQNKKETMRCPKRTSSIVWGHCNGFRLALWSVHFLLLGSVSLLVNFILDCMSKLLVAQFLLVHPIPLITSLQVRNWDCLSEFQNIHEYKEVHTKSKALLTHCCLWLV